jgi:hypothetical protein
MVQKLKIKKTYLTGYEKKGRSKQLFEKPLKNLSLKPSLFGYLYNSQVVTTMNSKTWHLLEIPKV